MKIIVAILFVISTVSATGQSRRFRLDPTEFRLLDALQYTCTDLLPRLEHLNYFSDLVGDWKMGLQPICTSFQEAGGPYAFDATKFCNFVSYYLQLGGLDLLDYHGVGPQSKIVTLAFFFNRILSNTTRNLYGMDLNNHKTICPNAYRLFQPPLETLLEELIIDYYTELLSALIPEIESICQDWKSYFAILGVPYDSPYQQLVGNLLDIGSEVVGFPIYEEQCKKMKPMFGQDYAGRRSVSNMIVSLFIKDEL